MEARGVRWSAGLGNQHRPGCVIQPAPRYRPSTPSFVFIALSHRPLLLYPSDDRIALFLLSNTSTTVATCPKDPLDPCLLLIVDDTRKLGKPVEEKVALLDDILVLGILLVRPARLHHSSYLSATHTHHHT